MSSTPPSGGTVFVELLEPRIAPTGLVALAGDPTGGSNITGDPRYITFNTPPNAVHPGFVPASAYGINVPNVFAIKLTGNGTFDAATGLISTGDQLDIFNAVTGFNVPSVQANNGTVVAFFLDRNALPGGNPALAGQVFADELVGISVGKKASLTVNINVHGDIVTNLNGAGTLVSSTSVGKPSFGIGGLTMAANVFGDILSGGDIKNINLVGSVDNVLAGTATNGHAVDFSGGTAAPTGIISNVAKAGKHGANINNVTVNTLAANGRIQSGDGGLTAVGGAITNVLFNADTDAFTVQSGAGGDGTAGVIGGTGGTINTVTVVGAAATSVNVPITILGGHGGNNAAGHGGTGGMVQFLAIGADTPIDPATDMATVSADLLGQNVIVRGGDGGSGIKGGNGGVVTDSQIVGVIPDDGVTGANGPNPEIQVMGGNGGVPDSADRGKGGRGGNVAQVVAENRDTASTGLAASILVQGGLGGAAARGGNVSFIDLLGSILTVNGGDGGSGINKGGNGGSLNSVGIESQTGIFAHQITLNGGIGGNGTSGVGGAGGNVYNIDLPDADLTTLTINSGLHANGGTGGNGVGGAGGNVGADTTAAVVTGGVSLNNSAPSGVIGTVAVRTGVGGDGTRGGGAGGSVDTFDLLGVDFSFSLTAGAGGNTTGTGAGGVGGSLTNVGISNVSPVATALANPTGLSGAVSSGAGGVGGGAGGLGGKGGDLTGVSLNVVYNVSVVAGAAGDGPSGAGAGGLINGGAATSLQGSTLITAGSGGLNSGSASNGGSINAFVAAAQTNIALISGNGGSGGSGGSITSCGTTDNALTGVPNVGNLTVTAGNGTSRNGVAGVGGSITGFTGSVADGGTTAITAGAGGGGATSTASGHGGGIDTVTLTGTRDASELINGATTQTITIDGGAGGAAGNAARGRTGGSVNAVTIYDLDTGTVVQHIAAGDGASGLRKGGAGGNVTEVHVGLPGDAVADIGIRSGAAFGYAAGDAGGIFAGVGGNGSKHLGANGIVNDITAAAISSIVAGKDTPRLCAKVTHVDLEGFTVLTADATGAFTNIGTANFVGSVQNPTAPGASTFKQGDGLIATADPNDLPTNNFAGEAVLTVDAAGNLILVDQVEPADAPITSPAATVYPFLV